MTKILVVDTNIYCGSGKPYPDGTSKMAPNHCRQLLEAILDQNHKVAFSQQSLLEWNKHVKNIFTKQWFGYMRLRRKVVFKENEHNSFSTLLASNMGNILEERYPHIEKDAFLFDLALATDKIIVSQEKRVLAHITYYPHLFSANLKEINYALLTADPQEHSVLIDWLHNHCTTPDYLIF